LYGEIGPKDILPPKMQQKPIINNNLGNGSQNYQDVGYIDPEGYNSPQLSGPGYCGKKCGTAQKLAAGRGKDRISVERLPLGVITMLIVTH
jgi:hypothetical protein